MITFGTSHRAFKELGATNLEDEAVGPGVLGERISSLQISGKGLRLRQVWR